MVSDPAARYPRPACSFVISRRHLWGWEAVPCARRQGFLRQALPEVEFYLLPDGRRYISAAHTEADVEVALKSLGRVFVEHKHKLIPTKVARTSIEGPLHS
jgi:hypothetical protein